MENLDSLFDLLPEEISRNLAAMSQTDDLAAKKTHSEIILNLSKAMGVFLDVMDMSLPDDFDDIDFEEPPFASSKAKKGKSAKKKNNRGDLPF